MNVSRIGFYMNGREVPVCIYKEDIALTVLWLYRDCPILVFTPCSSTKRICLFWFENSIGGVGNFMKKR